MSQICEIAVNHLRFNLIRDRSGRINVIQLSACNVAGTEGGGRASTLGPGNVAASGLSCRKPLVGTGYAISLLLCTNGLRKWSSGHVGPPFLAVKLFSRSVGAAIGQKP